MSSLSFVDHSKTFIKRWFACYFSPSEVPISFLDAIASQEESCFSQSVSWLVVLKSEFNTSFRVQSVSSQLVSSQSLVSQSPVSLKSVSLKSVSLQSVFSQSVSTLQSVSLQSVSSQSPVSQSVSLQSGQPVSSTIPPWFRGSYNNRSVIHAMPLFSLAKNDSTITNVPSLTI